MQKRVKGFTLIELLTTIIILGLLVTIGYISIQSIIERGNNSYYKSQEDMIILAAKEYYADHREELPDNIGDTSTVTLETLINGKYIDPVKDKDDNDCNGDKSSVTVQKITNRDYQYYLTLVCEKYETTEDTAKPVITFTPNKKSSTKSISVKMKVVDNAGVASYRYVIKKAGEDDPYFDSEYQSYTEEITIELTEIGLYEITGYAIDVNGNKASRKSGKYSIYKGINCAEVDFSSNIEEEKWTNKDVTVNVKLPSNTYRWELSGRINGGTYNELNNYIGSGSTKVTLDTDGKNQLKLVLYDKDGNQCIVETEEYFIDKTAPGCVSGGGSNNWTNQDITLTGTCSDSGSGCTGNVTKDFKTNTNTTTASPGTVKDKAGNTTTCPANQTVKIDKTDPTCTSSGGSNNWTNQDITLIGTCSDTGGSGCVGNINRKFSSNTNATNQSPGAVRDNAGNSVTCPANQTVKIDKTPPGCVSSGGSNNWTKNNITLTGTCSDTGGSGCTGNVTNVFKKNTNTTTASPGTVKDNAGNNTACPANQTVRIDKTKPVLNYTLTKAGGGSYNSGETSDKNVIRHLDPTDTGGSGIKETQINRGNGDGWEKVSHVDSYTFKKDHSAKYRTIDNAGNVSDVVKINIKIQKKSVSILNANYDVCPNDQNVPNRTECATGLFNTMYVSNVSANGLDVTFHIILHMNNTAVSWEIGQTRTLCIANSSSECVYNLASFNIGTSNWTSVGANPINQTYTADVSNLSVGKYRIIVDGATEKFRFKTSSYVLDTFEIVKG